MTLKLKRVSSFSSAPIYFEIHYYLPDNDDTLICDSYRGKSIRSYSCALKCLDYIKNKYPSAFDFEIAQYDDSGRIA